MVWVRIVVDGIIMSALFNAAAAMLWAINPAFFTTIYPNKIQEIASKNQNAGKDHLLFALFAMLPITLYGIISAYLVGLNGFWNLFLAGYIEWVLINIGDFFGLDLLLKEKIGKK